jgi:hypothetical protein
MRPHARAVFLLGGWLLMQPYALGPHSIGRPNADTWALEDEFDRPVNKWEHVASFDTAAECERARGRLAQEAERKWGGKKDEVGSGANVMWGQAASARCVPAEYVYPPQPPAQK